MFSLSVPAIIQIHNSLPYYRRCTDIGPTLDHFAPHGICSSNEHRIDRSHPPALKTTFSTNDLARVRSFRALAFNAYSVTMAEFVDNQATRS
jgi:hypothetical protein